jgi:hypothetical protein
MDVRQLRYSRPVAWLLYATCKTNAILRVALKQDQDLSLGIGNWAAPKNWTEIGPAGPSNWGDQTTPWLWDIFPV